MKKHFNFKSVYRAALVALCLITVGVGEMWAWWWVPGTIHNNGVFNSTLTEGKDGGIFQMPEGNTITFYNVPAGTNEFKLVKGDEWGHGVFTNKSESIITELCSNCSNSNNKIVTNAACDLTFTITNETDWNCDVTASSPTYYIKYNWGNDGWAWSGALISNGGNMYSCNGAYSGNGSYDHTRLSSTDADGTNTTATVKNSPSEDDNCLFEYNASTKALTITRCNHVNNGNHIYFDNSVSNFTGNIYLVIGHDKPTAYSKVYQLTQVTGTKLYHIDFNTDTWSDVTYYAIIASSSNASTLNGDYKWGSSSLSTKGDGGYTAAYTGNYDLNGTSSSYKTFLITTASSGNNKDMSIQYYADKDALPKVNASQAAKKRDTGTAYSNVSGDWPATLNLRGSQMKNATDTTRSTITSTTSEDEDGNKTCGAIRTGEITHTYESLSGSYHFEGWGTGSTPSNTDASYSYNITAATTVYAFFSKLYTLTYATKGEDTGSSLSVFSIDGYSGSKTSGSSIPTGHMITLVATPATGYEVEGWYSDASCETAYTSGSGDVTIEDNNTFKLSTINADTAVYCKFRPKTYSITLEDMEPTTPGQGSVSVTYNASTNMTASDEVTKPTKTNYDFGGYWVRNEDTKALVTQLIDADGKWIADKTGYTSHSGDDPTWVHDYAISLFAKWTETAYTITPSVTPAGAGSVNTVTDAHIITASSTITATPANAAWIFDYWEYGTHVGKAGGDGNAITVTSDMNSTITAHFKPRYELVGSYWENSSDKRGMPGWTYDGTGEFTYNGFTALGTGTGTGCDLSHSCALDKNTTYIFQIHDRVTGNHGNATVEYFGEGDTLLFNTKDRNVTLAATGAGTYTFRIINITEGVNDYYPTVTIERPHQVYFGQKYLDIDGTLHEGTTGGSASVKVGETAKTSGDYVNYNTSVTHDIDEVTGYHFAGWWGSDEYEGARFSNVHPMTYAVTSDDHAFAKFTEDSTHVHFANDGHGHVEIGGVTRTDTIVGITTHRKIVGVPDVGYKFSSWAKTLGSDYDIDNLSSDTATLSGNGGGATSGQTVTANFTYRWALKAESDGWGAESFTIENISTDDSGDVVGYVERDLAANTNYQFTIKDLQTNDIYKNNNVAVQYMTYSTHENWGFATTYTYNCGITTAGKGTYRFTWNITDKTMTVTYPDSYQVNYGASPSVGGSITVVDDDSQVVPNGGYVRSGGDVTYTVTANPGYTFVGWFTDDTYGTWFSDTNPWPNENVKAASNAYAKFKSTNFVIYRTGDMEDDPRAAYDDVESFDGGTISEVIELRMKVHELDKWYSLYLPYTVDSVCVYDVDEAKYYKMQPYFRKTLGGKLYAGHYIIRKPELTNDSIALSNFGDWRDPGSSTFTPSGNTPYIIQWHNSYFEGKYVSFFGKAGQSIDSSFSEGEAPKTKNWVTVHGNNSMKSGSVVDAYTLDGDEIWVRPVDKGESVAILPFECYIRANSEVTNKYLVLRRGMNTDDTPTGWESVSIPSEKASKVLMDGQLYIIRGNQIYTIQGALVK